MAATLSWIIVMPVTTGFSRKFYERLGDDIADELVDWFNHSFDAAVTQRFAQGGAKLEHRLTEVRAEVERHTSAIEATIDRQCSALRDETARARNGLLTWMFAFWATTILMIVSLAVA